VALHVERLREVQEQAVALGEVDGVVTLAHGGVGRGVPRTGQHPRRGGQYLARARHWGEGTRKTTGHRTPMGSNGIRRDLKPSA
jgi:hypothetical protein